MDREATISRNGSGVYSLPAGSTVANGDISDASDINGPLADLEADANVARPIVAGGTGATTASAARTALGLAIGTDVQAYDAGLASIAGLTTAADKMIYTTAADTYAVATLTAAARGLLDDATVADMRATLAVGDNVNNTSTIQTADANNCTASGFYRLQNTCANLPEAGSFDLLVISANGTEVTQVAVKTTGASTWRRVRTGGSWTAWVLMIDTGNIASYVGTTATIQNSTSGTAIDFTGIPANVSEITVMFDGVSLSGTDTILVQIGDSGGVETTGYVSGSQDAGGMASSTSGFAVRATTAADVLTGSMILTSMSTAGTRWVQQHGMYRNGVSAVSGGGSKTLSAMINRVRITRTGTDTFDAGAITIRYR